MKFICNNIERQKERTAESESKTEEASEAAAKLKNNKQGQRRGASQCTVRNKYAKKDSNAKAATEAGNSRGWRALQSALISSKWPVK